MVTPGTITYTGSISPLPRGVNSFLEHAIGGYQGGGVYRLRRDRRSSRHRATSSEIAAEEKLQFGFLSQFPSTWAIPVSLLTYYLAVIILL